LDYLRNNRDVIEQAVGEIPGLSMAHIEATYLAWINVRGVEDPATFFEQAGVGLSDGREFGMPGYVRLNFGCRRTLLLEALARIRRAIRNQ
jgi:cystathionine beta-lyase